MICIDNDHRLEEVTRRLKSRRSRVEEVGPNYRKYRSECAEPLIAAYECNLLDRNAIREVAKKIEKEVGGIDVLVTCAGQSSNQDIFDVASTTLMSHYWVNVSQWMCP